MLHASSSIGSCPLRIQRDSHLLCLPGWGQGVSSCFHCSNHYSKQSWKTPNLLGCQTSLPYWRQDGETNTLISKFWSQGKFNSPLLHHWESHSHMFSTLLISTQVHTPWKPPPPLPNSIFLPVQVEATSPTGMFCLVRWCTLTIAGTGQKEVHQVKRNLSSLELRLQEPRVRRPIIIQWIDAWTPPRVFMKVKSLLKLSKNL